MSEETPRDRSLDPTDGAAAGSEEAVEEDPRPVEHIFRWDLDKTYLQTDFDRVRDLVRTAFQKPEEKQNVPGAIPLLQALLRDRDETRRLVYFVSGSPRQMRGVLERKLALDGIRPQAFVLKPNLENILKLRFRAVRAQVGYKLRALLENQYHDSALIPETLFGDDAEQDAAIYSIYAEVTAGRLRGDRLAQLLKEAEVYRNNIDAIMAVADTITEGERVQRIFIILDRRSPLAHFKMYAPRLVAVYNYFQAALVLFQDGVLEQHDLQRIALNMIARDGYSAAQLASSFQDLLRRGVLRRESLTSLSSALKVQAKSHVLARHSLTLFDSEVEALGGFDPPPPAGVEAIDYVECLKRELTARKQHKEALKQQKTDAKGDTTAHPSHEDD